MSGSNVNIMTILDPCYQECHDLIISYLKDDMETLYSCIRVNRTFCRIFIPILWKNPFKLIKKDDDRLIQVFNTLIQCLDPSDKKWLSRKSIEIEKLSTPRAYFNYQTFIKEFELNPLQKAMRFWTSRNFSSGNDLPRNGQSRVLSGGRRVSKRVFYINKYIGDLFFNKGGQYETLNLFYNDLLSGPRSILDICEHQNHKYSLVNVKKFSIGLFNNNGTDLMTPVTEYVLKLQNVLSPNIQHFQILHINSIKPKLSRNLINFIQSQNQLKSLLLSHEFWRDEFEPFLNALRKHSKSLTVFKLESSILFTSNLLSMLKSLPNLITLELRITLTSDRDVSREITTITLDSLEHLSYDCFTSHNTNSITIFKQILLSAKKLKSLKVEDSYCPYIKEIQGLCFSNLTHFHLVLIMHSISLVDLLELLRSMYQLVHLKLSTAIIRNNTLNHVELFNGFPKVLACSLKIFEFNLPVSDKSLEKLLDESQFKLECLKLYRLERYPIISLKVFIDYAKRKGSFKELGITKEFKFSKERVVEAMNYFKITVLTDGEIYSPFYDLPIQNSYWSNRR
ncbi:15799_t:CDS:2 [Funneliformis mosseae]|uniref:15799_t:CDS:1 n=1 Tax=Funneliformis mosseae TaxID=27381 RepID=A0A9N9EXL4_FUNMO|nr:15799_t:CDS:2 [Funneliformis mosseae]